MMAALNQFLEASLSSPWAYLAIFAMVVLDAVLPIFPSETIVVAATIVSLGTGQPLLLMIVLIAAVAAFLGDQAAYALGRSSRRTRPGPRRRTGKWARSIDWAEHAVRERPWQIIVSGRFIPGGRTAVSMVCGSMRYPHAVFAAASAVGAVLWAITCVALGWVGGAAFHDNPLLAVAVGVGAALALTGAIELARALVSKRTAVQLKSAAPVPENAGVRC
jgi:membrane protein DedA with SNARE-associated domain